MTVSTAKAARSRGAGATARTTAATKPSRRRRSCSATGGRARWPCRCRGACTSSSARRTGVCSSCARPRWAGRFAGAKETEAEPTRDVSMGRSGVPSPPASLCSFPAFLSTLLHLLGWKHLLCTKLFGPVYFHFGPV
jgi:hypothetical protein